MTLYTYPLIDIQGPTGPTGPTGAFGYTGSQGAGYTGSASSVTGPSGPTGPDGLVGFRGSQGTIGFTGSRGFTGSAGVDGVDGVVGYRGSQGVTGYTGSQGEQGTIGSTGYTGSQGLRGFTGYTGSSGAVGYTGSAGENGYIGSQGLRGFTGYTGSQGTTGFTGSAGVDGVVGYRGSQGDTGYTGSVGFTGSVGLGIAGYTGSIGSGYTGSVGFTGSIGLGIAGYTGSIGSGYTGSSGDVGYTGSVGVGIAGYTGSVGLQGESGYTGSRGEDAAVGYRGSQGDPGETGYTGSRGAVGFTGSAGFTGSVGYTGSRGDLGFTGSVGYTGSRGSGYTGSQGYTGSVGYTGSQGDRGQTGIGYTGSLGLGELGYTGSRGLIGYTGSQGIPGTGGLSNIPLSNAALPGLPTYQIPVATGLYAPADNQVGIATNSVARMLVTDSQSQFTNDLAGVNAVFTSGANQITLNTTDGAMEIVRSSGGAYIDFKNSAVEDYDARIAQFNNGLTVFTNGSVQSLTIDNSGNLGIGTISPGTKLDVQGTNVIVQSKATSGYAVFQSDSTTGNLSGYLFKTGGTETARMVSDSSNILSFATGSSGTEKMRINNTGFVGIGTNSPAYLLDIRAASNTQFHMQGNTSGVRLGSSVDTPVAGAGYFGTYSTHPVVFGANNTERMRISSSGNVGIGNTGPTYGLDILNKDFRIVGVPDVLGASSGSVAINCLPNSTPGNGTDTRGISLASNGTVNISGGGLGYYVMSVNKVAGAPAGRIAQFRNSDKLVAYITDEGYIWSGDVAETTERRLGFRSDTRSAHYYMTTNSNAPEGRIGLLDGTANIVRWETDIAGNLFVAGTVNAVSDMRMKENVNTLVNSLDTVKRLRGVSYQKIDTKQKSLGVIAQELQAVVPELVLETYDEQKTLSVAYGNMAGLFIEAIKELDTKIQTIMNNLNLKDE